MIFSDVRCGNLNGLKAMHKRLPEQRGGEVFVLMQSAIFPLVLLLAQEQKNLVPQSFHCKSSICTGNT